MSSAAWVFEQPGEGQHYGCVGDRPPAGEIAADEGGSSAAHREAAVQQIQHAQLGVPERQNPVRLETPPYDLHQGPCGRCPWIADDRYLRHPRRREVECPEPDREGARVSQRQPLYLADCPLGSVAKASLPGQFGQPKDDRGGRGATRRSSSVLRLLRPDYQLLGGDGAAARRFRMIGSPMNAGIGICLGVRRPPPRA
jgi:hypothetical protein